MDTFAQVTQRIRTEYSSLKSLGGRARSISAEQIKFLMNDYGHSPEETPFVSRVAFELQHGRFRHCISDC
jgi:hypothetical protein